MRTLKIEPLTKGTFAPFGDVTEAAGSDYLMVNNGPTHRCHKLATVETARQEDSAITNIFSVEKLEMLLHIRILERHPLDSQISTSLLDNPLLVMVVPLGDVSVPGPVHASLISGRQGANYYRGVRHHPVLAIGKWGNLLVVDHGGPGNNCDGYLSIEDEQFLLDPQSNR